MRCELRAEVWLAPLDVLRYLPRFTVTLQAGGAEGGLRQVDFLHRAAWGNGNVLVLHQGWPLHKGEVAGCGQRQRDGERWPGLPLSAFWVTWPGLVRLCAPSRVLTESGVPGKLV